MNVWLVKSEPETYSWETLVKEGRTAWTGVRNYQARIHLRAMARGDLVLFYHSGEAKEIVGLASVAKTAYPDPTSKDGDWSCVDLAPVKPLAQPVSLQVIKADKLFQDLALVRNSRLSVSPVSQAQFRHLLKLAATDV